MSDNESMRRVEGSGDEHAPYSLEVVCEITGLSSQTVAHYRKIGLLPTGWLANDVSYSDETIRILRQIEHLRSEFGMSESALKLMLGLLDEIDDLRTALRSRRLK